MPLFTVDEKKCTLCGACLDECPFRLLEMKTRDSFPTPREIPVRSAQERCINCGHCVVVCPTDALTLYPTPHSPNAPERQVPTELERIRPDLKVSKEQMAHLLKSRRTHRAFQDRQVPRQVIEEIIDVARYAPSGHNGQRANWLVISDKSEMRRIGQTVVDGMKHRAKENPQGFARGDADVIVDLWEKGEDSVFRGAPHLVILYGPSGSANMYAGREMYAIRMAYTELAAIPHGVATVWNGFFILSMQLWPPTQQAIGLPEGQEAYDSMSIGYPKNLYRRIPLRNKPIVTWR